MKKYFILILVLFSTQSFAQVQSKDCPFGSDKNVKTHFIDSMKNRYAVPKTYTVKPFDYIYNMVLSDDYSACTQAITFTGYVLAVEDGGQESCNCGSATIKDTHIYVVRDSTVKDKSEAIIVEITPAFRALFGSTLDLRHALVGQMVTFSGYLFQDQEHKMNSTIDKGNGHLWRHTIWEMHPVSEVTVKGVVLRAVDTKTKATKTK